VKNFGNILDYNFTTSGTEILMKYEGNVDWAVMMKEF
jgi:hypothetical protein